MEKNREFLMFAAAVGQAGFGHIFAQSLCVGPIGTVAVSCRTEEPGEQRFCQDQRLKQPMGLPFSEWADNKTHPPVAMARIPAADCGNRTYLSETTNDLLCLTEAFGAAASDSWMGSAYMAPVPHLELATNQHGIPV
jgi:hypothetical protein